MATNEEYLNALRANRQKAAHAIQINNSMNKFKAMREARVKQEREADLFQLDKQESNLRIKKLEMDPMMDPGQIALEKKKLSLGLKEKELELKKQEKINQYATADTAKQMQMLGEKAKALNTLTEQHPEIFGDLYIVPNMETGEVELKPKSTGALTEYQRRTLINNKQQAIQAINSGKVYDKSGGLDATTQIDSKDDMLAYVASLNVDMNDPDIQEAINKKFGSAESGGKYKLGDVIESKNGKKFKIVGLDDPNDPDVEEVK